MILRYIFVVVVCFFKIFFLDQGCNGRFLALRIENRLIQMFSYINRCGQYLLNLMYEVSKRGVLTTFQLHMGIKTEL